MARVSILFSKAFTILELLTVNYILAGGTKSTFLFKKDAGKRFTNITTTVTKETPIQCGRLCGQTTWCALFNFHRDDHACELCPFYPGDNVLIAFDDEWDMYYADDDCLSSPCLNSGTCTDTIESYECSCESGYEGSNCETAPTEAPDEIFASSCDMGWTLFQDSCYLFDENQVERDMGQATCELYSSMSHLVYITSKDEQDFITTQLTGASTGEGIWLGATYNAVTSQFEWNDESAMTFGHWNTGEPNGSGSETCAGAATNINFYWYDVACDRLLSILCEYELLGSG